MNEINKSVQFSIGRVYLLSIIGTKSIKLKFFFFYVRENIAVRRIKGSLNEIKDTYRNS